MKSWEEIRSIIDQVLSKQKFTKTGSAYHGKSCFLTAYQLAVLVDQEDRDARGSLPIGGKGVGYNSFAQQIARSLSEDIRNGDTTIDIQFLSRAGLESFTFDGGHSPSPDEFSMFRLV